jgi:hypothetical protein
LNCCNGVIADACARHMDHHGSKLVATTKMRLDFFAPLLNDTGPKQLAMLPHL